VLPEFSYMVVDWMNTVKLTQLQIQKIFFVIAASAYLDYVTFSKDLISQSVFVSVACVLLWSVNIQVFSCHCVFFVEQRLYQHLSEFCSVCTVGSHFTTGLRSRMFGRKSNRLKTITI